MGGTCASSCWKNDLSGQIVDPAASSGHTRTSAACSSPAPQAMCRGARRRHEHTEHAGVATNNAERAAGRCLPTPSTPSPWPCLNSRDRTPAQTRPTGDERRNLASALVTWTGRGALGQLGRQASKRASLVMKCRPSCGGVDGNLLPLRLSSSKLLGRASKACLARFCFG